MLKVRLAESEKNTHGMAGRGKAKIAETDTKTQITEKWLKTDRVLALGLRPEDFECQTVKEAQRWGEVKSLPVATVYKVFLKIVKDNKNETVDEAGFKSLIEVERAVIEAERAKQMDTWFHGPGHQLQ